MPKITCTLSSKISKETGESEILIRFQKRGFGNKRAHSHIWISRPFFDQESEDIKIAARKLTPEVRDAYDKKGKLEHLKTFVIRAIQDTDLSNVSDDWLQDTVDRFTFPEKYIDGQKKDNLTFFEAFDKFIGTRKLSVSRYKHYRVLERILLRWELYRCKKIEIDSITADDLEDFRKFVRNEHKFFRTDKSGNRKPTPKYAKIYAFLPESRYPVERGDNAINSFMKMFRAFYNWCTRQGITENDPFRKFTIGSQVYGSPIYITAEEREQIYHADLSQDKRLETQRDIFIFQCFIGCRISDLYSLTKKNLITDNRGTYVEYVPIKTKDENPNIVKVYLTEEAKAIVDKYKDYDETKLFPLIAQQNYNYAIKDVFHKVGIERMVTVRNPLTGENEQKCIADVASSHMARKTFIGNLYKQVKDPNLVGKLSGHKEGSHAFARYRNIDDDLVKEMSNLMESDYKPVTEEEKSEIINRKAETKDELMKKLAEIQQLVSSGQISPEEFSTIIKQSATK